MNDNWGKEFEELREKALRDQQYLQKKLIHQWLNGVVFPYTVSFKFNLIDHELKLYTTHPGELIGYRGRNINVLKELLSKAYDSSWVWKINTIEIGGSVKASDVITQV